MSKRIYLTLARAHQWSIGSLTQFECSLAKISRPMTSVLTERYSVVPAEDLRVIRADLLTLCH